MTERGTQVTTDCWGSGKLATRFIDTQPPMTHARCPYCEKVVRVKGKRRTIRRHNRNLTVPNRGEL